MGKRSDFERRERDDYPTPYEGVLPLLPHLRGIRTFAEPCAGEGRLIAHLERHGLQCVSRSDIVEGTDARDLADASGADAIITNPPWSCDVLHPLIGRLQSLAPTWLLFDADWLHTRQASPYLDQCSHVVSVGRLKWIPGSKFTGKDNAAWYRFHAQHEGGPRLIGRTERMAA